MAVLRRVGAVGVDIDVLVARCRLRPRVPGPGEDPFNVDENRAILRGFGDKRSSDRVASRAGAVPDIPRPHDDQLLQIWQRRADTSQHRIHLRRKSARIGLRQSCIIDATRNDNDPRAPRSYVAQPPGKLEPAAAASVIHVTGPARSGGPGIPPKLLTHERCPSSITITAAVRLGVAIPQKDSSRPRPLRGSHRRVLRPNQESAKIELRGPFHRDGAVPRIGKRDFLVILVAVTGQRCDLGGDAAVDPPAVVRAAAQDLDADFCAVMQGRGRERRSAVRGCNIDLLHIVPVRERAPGDRCRRAGVEDRGAGEPD